MNAHTNSSNTVARCSSALAFAARSVLQGENGTRSDVCRELFVQLGDAAVPFSPFLPPPLPSAPALRCLGRAIDFPFPFLPQRNATVFGAARSACVAALMRPERLRLSGVRSALVRLAACRGWNDGISMWTVDKWTVDFFFFLNWRHPLLSFFLSFAKVKFSKHREFIIGIMKDFFRISDSFFDKNFRLHLKICVMIKIK